MTRHLWFALLSSLLLFAVPTTTASAANAGQTIFVDINAAGNGDGTTSNPFRTMEAALDIAGAGDTIKVRPGTYPPVTVRGITGSQALPVVIEGTNDGVIFTDNAYTRRYGILIQDSSHVTVRNVTARHSLAGVMVQNSSNILIDSVRAFDTGQEGMHVQHGSHDVTIQNSFIADTGNRPDKVGIFPVGQAPGEGIYIGSGRSNGQDRVWNISILNNEITRTNHEAIDIKAPAHDILIADNHIHDISTYISGAVVFHLGAHPTPPANIVFERNIIDGVTSTSPHNDGNCVVVSAAAEIRNNVIVNCQHRGIFIQDGFPTTDDRDVAIHHNTLFNTGTNGALSIKNGSTANLTTQNNLGLNTPGNLAVAASDFVSVQSRDFRPQAGSRAVDSADPVAGLLTDLVSNPRVSGQAADFGAFELPSVSAIATAQPTQAPATTQAPPTTQAPATAQAPSTTQAPATTSTAPSSATTSINDSSGGGSTTTALPKAAGTSAPQPSDTVPTVPERAAEPGVTTTPTSDAGGVATSTPSNAPGSASDPGSTTTAPAIVGGAVDVAPPVEFDPLSANAGTTTPQTTNENVGSDEASSNVPANTDEPAGEDLDTAANDTSTAPARAPQAGTESDAPDRLPFEAPIAPNDVEPSSADLAFGETQNRTDSGLGSAALVVAFASLAVALVGALVMAPSGRLRQARVRLGRR